MSYKELLNKLNTEQWLEDKELLQLVFAFSPESEKYAMNLAGKKALSVFGNKIYYRGIVEFTNICRNNCYYCGLRKDNEKCKRYRLTEDQILSCCENGYRLGMRTFVLQGGEDIAFDVEFTDLIKKIHVRYPECAITLGAGERPDKLYREWYESGATRYLLRHETADKKHYELLHPDYQHFDNRMRCLNSLKKMGYQTGAGMMVGSPYQTYKELCEDLIFLRDFKPEMVGIGPFIPHHDTPFRDKETGSFDLTLYLLAIVRLLLPTSLIPATTAMDTVIKDGRLQAVKAGCNVIMLNITPLKERKDYRLYDDMAELNKMEGLDLGSLNAKFNTIGYEAVIDRGDYKEGVNK